ncbi:hypothetical protein [Rubrobacter marinus]|uniref:hypothetical protein n=1 Tax=Rubrobacter marinus TaxID=2653852 RepID=UPI00140CD240|nr:hypothetical protein [Rubrobacter marinus]
MMAVVQERARETREGVSSFEGSRTADWEAVIAAYLVDDWPPPEWLAAAGEVSPGLSKA